MIFISFRTKIKIFLLSFGSFWIIFYIFDLCISKFVFKRSIFLQWEILEAHFWSSNSNFSCSFFRTFDQKFERSTGISNVRPEFRTFDRNFESSTGISNVRPESRTFDRNLDCKKQWKNKLFEHRFQFFL